MSFSADWLSLREPYDRRARNAAVLDAVAAAFKERASVAVVDLACGTGSTLRALEGRLPARQDWRLVDNDLSLLARAIPPPREGRVARAVPVDLARDLEAALDGPVELVTTSALLDLTSAEWIERLASETAARNLPIYCALTYDGRADVAPGDPDDAHIIEAVNRHQRRDKGFGAALGPDAFTAAKARFTAVGYRLLEGPSDWVMGPQDTDMQREIFAGWASAAREIEALPLADIAGWLTRRRDLIAAGRSETRVGHVDFFAVPMGWR